MFGCRSRANTEISDTRLNPGRKRFLQLCDRDSYSLRVFIMEMCRFGLVLVLALWVALPTEAQPPNVIHRYRNFLNQHVYSGMAERMCNSEIDKRKITDGDTNNCKEVNTFIKASSTLIKAVCGRATGLYTSGQPFTVVTCTLQGGERRPRCDYGRKGHESTRYITIACDQGWPVHYQEDKVVVG